MNNRPDGLVTVSHPKWRISHISAEEWEKDAERTLFMYRILRFAVQVAGALAFVGLVYLAFHVIGIAMEN